jgi:DNA polymerase III epsilon subunit family exonuclease
MASTLDTRMPRFPPPPPTMNRPLLVLDTETATLLGAPHLLELAAIRVVDGEAEDHFQSLVLPQVPISAEATAIHGIDDEEVRTASPTAEVLERFSRWAGDAWLVAHNAPFDARVLGFEYARAGLLPPSGPFIDTLPLARRCFPEAADHKLTTLAEMLELENDGAHRALPDAAACWQLLEACVEQLGGWASVDASTLLMGRAGPLTITGAMPRRPGRPPSRVRQLERAQQDGAAVRLLYGEKGTTPAPLEVTPRLLYQERQRGYLEGECASSGLLKTYRLDRIQRIDPLN